MVWRQSGQVPIQMASARWEFAQDAVEGRCGPVAFGWASRSGEGGVVVQRILASRTSSAMGFAREGG